MNDTDEFYIGYEPGLPQRIRRAVTAAVCAAGIMGALAAVTFISQQRPLAESRFEFGQTRTFTGYLTRVPAPALWVGDGTPYWLVAPGKFGAAATLGSVDEGWVELSGSLIERERWRMIEVPRGGVRRMDSNAPSPVPERTRSLAVTVTGEIVDSKCFLGVMNPGERTVHRDCAVRCLAGGVPPMLSYRDAAGSHLALLLGHPALTADHVGRAMTLSGYLSGPEEALVLAISDDH